MKNGKAEQHRMEFRRQVKDLSSTELVFRTDLNTKDMVTLTNKVKAFSDSLNAARRQLKQVEWERAVLNTLLGERR